MTTNTTDALRAILGGNPPNDDPPADVHIEHREYVTVITSPAWTCVALAVLDAGTDDLLVAAALSRAQAAAEESRSSEPTAQAQLITGSLQGPVLAWVLDTGGDEGRAAAADLLASAEVGVAEIRRGLPGSVCLAVAGLPPGLLVLYQRAARMAVLARSDRVEVLHLAAALLAEPDLWESQPLAHWPEPTTATLGLLLVPGGCPDPENWVRARVGDHLGSLATVARRRTHEASEPPRDEDGLVPVLRLIAPDPEEAKRPDVEALATQLCRIDINTVALVGPEPDRALAGLAHLATTCSGIRIAGRRVLSVDASALDDELLGVLTVRLNRDKDELILAVHVGPRRISSRRRSWATDYQVHALDGARLVGVPVVLAVTCSSAGALDFPSHTPVVATNGASALDLDRAGQAAEPVTDLVADLACAHGVTISLDAIEAARSVPARHPALAPDPLEDLPPDPLNVVRARLDYACARASLRPDRSVTVGDVPADPDCGVEAGTAIALPPSTVQLQTHLSLAILGQDAAVERMAVAVTGGTVRLSARTGPRAALLLAGPPGTGKTSTAPALAEALFGDRHAVIRIDCAGLYDRHTRAALLGAPAGYVGFDTADTLTTRIESHQRLCVVQFDEVDKADPGIADLLLGVLDSGWLADLQGRTVDASQCVFLLTSNTASGLFTAVPTGFVSHGAEHTEARVRAEISRRMRPELLDRLDDILIYRPLDQTALATLATRYVEQVVARGLASGYVLRVDPDVVEDLVVYAQTHGVRSLQRRIDASLVPPLVELPRGEYTATQRAGGRVAWLPTRPPETL